MDVLENAVTEKNVLVEAAAFPTDDRVTYKDSTYEIVSKVAYLIGVPTVSYTHLRAHET